MKLAFHTIGCKVNQYETQALSRIFCDKGYLVVDEHEQADIYIINTCTVTGLADRKSRQSIRKMKKQNPASLVVVTGCYAQTKPEEIEALDEVDLVFDSAEKSKLPEYIEAYLQQGNMQQNCTSSPGLPVYDEIGAIGGIDSRTRAYIKVQDGCDRFCSYCIVPHARGKPRSRDLSMIIEEAKGLIEQGFKELVLTGINTALYGMEPGFAFAESECKTAKENPPNCQSKDNQPAYQNGIEGLLWELFALPGDFRIRLSSLEPTVVNQEFVKSLLKYDRLCHHLHLSIQSGSDRILTAMNRPYGRNDYLEIVKVLKEFDPDYGITTDIIAGFPGEEEWDFKDSLRLIQEVGFCKVHVFPFSPRPQTPAADMKKQISSLIKKQRNRALIEAGENSVLQFFRQNSGKTRKVLFETYRRDSGHLIGYTDNYIKVYVKTKEKQFINQFADVYLKQAFRDGMTASLVS